MTLKEADSLAAIIGRDIKPEPCRVHRLGNGRDYVVILTTRSYWLWSLDDWLDFNQRGRMPIVPQLSLVV